MDSERFTGLIMVVGGGFLLYWFVSGKLPAIAYAVKTGQVPNIQNPSQAANVGGNSTANATINSIAGLGASIGGLFGQSQNNTPIIAGPIGGKL
jgi:hypothetical protein